MIHQDSACKNPHHAQSLLREAKARLRDQPRLPGTVWGLESCFPWKMKTGRWALGETIITLPPGLMVMCLCLQQRVQPSRP